MRDPANNSNKKVRDDRPHAFGRPYPLMRSQIRYVENLAVQNFGITDRHH